jgi:hypothetical protein
VPIPAASPVARVGLIWEEHGQALCAEIPRELSEGLGLRADEPAIADLRKLRVSG